VRGRDAVAGRQACGAQPTLPYPTLSPVVPLAQSPAWRCAPPRREAAPERARRRAAPGARRRRARAAQVFGQVVSGYGVVRAAEACGSRGGETSQDVVIADAGVLPPAAAAAGRPGASPAGLGVTRGHSARVHLRVHVQGLRATLLHMLAGGKQRRVRSACRTASRHHHAARVSMLGRRTLAALSLLPQRLHSSC